MSRIRSIYEEPFSTLPSKDLRYARIWIGQVIRVNEDDETVDINWSSYNAQSSSVSYSYANSGPRSIVGGPPEQGSLVLGAWTPYTAGGNCIPVVLGFIPRLAEFSKQFKIPYDTNTLNERTDIRNARPRLRQGDKAVISSKQSGMVANEDLKLFSAGLGEMFFRSTDSALLKRFVQENSFTAAGRRLVGLVERPGSDAPEIETDEGTTRQYVTSDGSSILDGGSAYTEDRLEIFPVSNGSIPLMEGEYGTTRADEFVSLIRVYGSLIGNDPTITDLYGKALQRDVCSPTLDPQYSETSDAASVSSYHFSLPGTSETTIDIDAAGRAAILLDGNSSKDNRALEMGIKGKTCIVTEDDMEVSVGGELVLTATENIAVGAQEDLLLDAGGEATLTALEDINIVSQANTFVDGTKVYLGTSTVGTAPAGRSKLHY